MGDVDLYSHLGSSHWAADLSFVNVSINHYHLDQNQKANFLIIKHGLITRDNAFVDRVFSRAELAALFLKNTHWNDYFWPLVMTTNETSRTLPLGIAKLREVDGGVAWNVLMAGNMILVIPILIVFFFAQRQIIRAFVYTGVK